MTILKTTEVHNLKQLTSMLYELYFNVKNIYKHKRLQETGKLGAMNGIIFSLIRLKEISFQLCFLCFKKSPHLPELFI